MSFQRQYPRCIVILLILILVLLWIQRVFEFGRRPTTFSRNGGFAQTVRYGATVCKTVRPMLPVRCLSVLSVTFVHCGQTVGRIKMKLGMQVGLSSWVSRLFVPWTIRTLDRSYPRPFVPWTIRTIDHSYPGPFVPWTVRTLDHSYPRSFVPCMYRLFVPWTVRALDHSYPKPFIP